MQKINIVCVGKLKEEYLRSAAAEYLKRLSRFAKVSVIEIAEGRTLKDESVSVMKALKGYVIALCVEGEKLSSEAFSEKLGTLADRGEELTFVIGSSCGLAPEVKSSADFKLSFSEMTFPHQLMRVILLEQVYRAFMIMSGGEYHK